MEKKRGETQTVFTSMIENPRDARVLAAVGLIHLLLAYFRIPGWSCPIFLATGVPCPGCGLTRASAALLEGDWETMAAVHLFAPVFLGAVVLTGIAAIIPVRWRDKFIYGLEGFESKTRITLVVIFGLLLYWGLRLGLNPDGLIALMTSTT